MASPGTCEIGCAEHKLLLARASTVDALKAVEGEILTGIAALRLPTDELMEAVAVRADWEAALDALRERARVQLSRPHSWAISAYVLDEPAEPVVAWWCDRCDGIDAPQPCLGICVWRSIGWARYEVYADMRQRVISEYETERRLRALLSRIVHTSPRPGQHSRACAAFAEAAASILHGNGNAGTR